MSNLENEQYRYVPFNKIFDRPPVVVLGGSVGNVANGYSSGGKVQSITTKGFTYYSAWEYSLSFELYWAAVLL